MGFDVYFHMLHLLAWNCQVLALWPAFWTQWETTTIQLNFSGSLWRLYRPSFYGSFKWCYEFLFAWSGWGRSCLLGTLFWRRQGWLIWSPVESSGTAPPLSPSLQTFPRPSWRTRSAQALTSGTSYLSPRSWTRRWICWGTLPVVLGSFLESHSRCLCTAFKASEFSDHITFTIFQSVRLRFALTWALV